MTHQELFKLHELKGRLHGRRTCLESDIASVGILIPSVLTEVYRARFEERLVILKQWLRENARLLEEIERIIKEAENDRE